MNKNRIAPRKKFRVLGVDLFSREDFVVGDYGSKAQAIKVAFSKKGDETTAFYVYDDKGRFIQ